MHYNNINVKNLLDKNVAEFNHQAELIEIKFKRQQIFLGIKSKDPVSI